MEKVAMEGYTFVDGGVCAAKGFRAGGVYCGIKDNPDKKNDLMVVAADAMCNAAAVYTQNKVKGAPVLVMKKHLKATCGKTMAVVANSKNANTCNADGEEKAEAMCALTAKELGVKPEEILVMSTGVIGQILPIEPIQNALPALCRNLKASAEGAHEAAVAIMTTDTFAKEIAVEFSLGGVTCHLGGMAKGSGMIHPNMATTLNCITTDAAVPAELLQKALSDVVKVTYNCLSVDGDQSTNATCLLMASGAAGNPEVAADSAEYTVFRNALYCVMMNLTRMLAYDGEGATKLLECKVSGAKDLDTAIVVAKSVVCSPLLKCAMFGADANWGRVLCAVGYAPAEFDINQVAVTLASRAGSVDVCRNGAGIEFSEDIAKKVLLEDEIEILVSIGDGPEISDMLKRLNIESKFIGGLRYTDEAAVDVVKMVLSGKVNKELVSLLTRTRGKALGMCGIDGHMLTAERKLGPNGEDLGFVGDIVKVNEQPILDALNNGYIPVIATVATDDFGQAYNVNADTAAARIAAQLRAENLILMTDIAGLLRDKDDPSTLIPFVNVSEVPFLKRKGIISGGMIPKIDCCVEAVRRGVKKTAIIDGRVPHSILIETLSNEGIGTQFR